MRTSFKFINFIMLTVAGIINAFVVNRFQIGKLRTIVHDNDSNAFITISEVTDVFGSGNHK